MKKTFHLYLILASIALGASLTSCLSSQVTVPSQATVTFTSTKYLSSTPTIALTPTWSGNYDEIATVSAAQTRAANFPRICDSYYPGQYSPNGVWLVELCASKDDNDLILTLSNRETQVLWKLLYHDYIPQMDFRPDGGMSVVHWSKDGRSTYFFSFLGGDSGECFYNGGDRGSGLFRIDLHSGQTTAILPPNNNFWWYGFSLSPTDRRLVYGARARDLKILDITTGELISVISVSNFDEGGGFLWSADGLKLIYSALTRGESGERENYSLRLVDAQSGSESILLESPENCFVAISWKEDNILQLKKNFGEALIEFDLNSNKIISENTTTP